MFHDIEVMWCRVNWEHLTLVFEASLFTGHTLYPGDSAEVCKSQGEEFTCSTADASINVTCDTSRCPLQGPPMAPIMESQLLTGWAEKCLEFFCKKWNEFKLNGFESLLFISNCVDINIVALHVMITIILREKKLYEKTNLQAVLAISIFDDFNFNQGKWWWAA